MFPCSLLNSHCHGSAYVVPEPTALSSLIYLANPLLGLEAQENLAVSAQPGEVPLTYTTCAFICFHIAFPLLISNKTVLSHPLVQWLSSSTLLEMQVLRPSPTPIY